ncbi:MAG: hypothetical protein F6J87_28730 [Spirulina sp. SIO3F2]|nr:hypothetical protein [Spirulina sp. SIO3F2]
MSVRESLWGEIPAPEDLPDLPKTILREQAEILTEVTGGALIGEVSQRNQSSQTFSAALSIQVPSLDNYIFNVVSIAYPIHLYPVTIQDQTGESQGHVCHTVEEYKEQLGLILSSERVKSVIAALLSQVLADSPTDS